MIKCAIKRKKKTLGETLFIIGMLFIPLVHFLIFWLYKNIDSILLAFQTSKLDGGVEWNLDNFGQLFKEFSLSDSNIFGALKNTFIFFFSDLLITFPLAILLSYFIYKRIPGFRVFRVIIYLPCIIAATVTSTLFEYIIAGNGPIAELLAIQGIEMPTLFGNSAYALKTLLFYTIFFGLGGNLVLLSGALNQIDKSILESANIDGANRFQELIYMIIPLMWPTLSTVLTFMFVGLFFTLIGAPIALIMRWLLSKGVDDVAG